MFRPLTTLSFAIGMLSLQLSAPADGRGMAWSSEISASAIAALAQDDTWRRLLHFSRGAHRSEINSPDFFLSPVGRDDPAAELRATLDAYGAAWTPDPDAHPRCRYPARFLWLSRHVDLPSFDARDPRCQRLEKWALLDRLRSASLLLVSGYFGNPASTFGHALLRLDTGEPGDSSLLDVTINYGALVPENELIALYVFRGLFGGYQSGFSDKYFYTEDLVYARTELRDIWEYELDLTDDQLMLLSFHLWEVIGRKFDYYFLTQNCAYRLAELIELATGEAILDHANLWYLPVEMFHGLQAVDARGPRRLIRAVRFVPSSQRELRHQFARLQSDEALATNQVIRSGSARFEPLTREFPEPARIAMADALLAYYQYRLVAEEPEPRPETRAAKDDLLRARLYLPAERGTTAPVPSLRSPAMGSAPMLTAVGLGVDGERGGYARMQFAAFHYDQIGFNSLDDGELVVLRAAAGIDRDGRAFVDEFDAVRVRKLAVERVPIEGERRWSWQTRIGADRIRRNDIERTEAVASFGIGRALALGPDITVFGMVDGVATTGTAPLGIEPNVGLIASAGRWKAMVHAGLRYELPLNNWRPRIRFEARYQLDRNHALRVEASRDLQLGRVLLSLDLFW